MATIAYDADVPGQAGMRPVQAGLGRVLRLVTGKFSFDSSYPTGGEDIADIANQFTSMLGMFIQQPIQTGAQTGKFIAVDYTNKKLQLFTNASPFAEVANASDQSGIANLRFLAWGI